MAGGIFRCCDIATERREIMLELCGTAIIIALICSFTRLLIKAMELSWIDRKNEKEGKYIN